MAKRDTGTRTMTNSEMQDRTTADVIGKAAGWDQRHSVGSCDVADLADRCPTCLVKMEWIHSHYPMPSLRLARLVLHVRGASEQCQTHREPTPTSTIAARSGGTPLFADRLAAARGECKKVFIELGRAA